MCFVARCHDMRRSMLAIAVLALLGSPEPKPFDPIIRPVRRREDGSDAEYPYDDNDPGVDVDADPPVIEDIITRCPTCRVRHIDAGEWKTRPHRTHLCLECGETWRPSESYTRGV